MIDNKVKLVVWDLDETFWRGTLSEEGIVAVDRNMEIVAALPKRGILNSICSKNDPDQTRAKLVELGVWDWFVFPSIGFNPKGKAVAEMIEGAALRAENVLFIDDNRMNLEEVKFFNPGIMTAHPDEVLDGLLDHPNMAGKPDPELTRLKQYKFLQRKVEDRSASDLSNEEFLRASNIKVTIDYEVERNFDRIVDLVNRANQLNYTKLRLNTPEDIAEFRALLGAYGSHAGCVHASDNYGDYGLIGFFLLKRRANKKRLIHFVFSCRTMNMGIEQYVHESLDRPDVDIVKPVSYGLESHAAVDWINVDGAGGSGGTRARDGKLVLVGACHLLQLASYCSTDRSEFVNVCDDGTNVVRFDDPGFITGDRAVLKESEALRRMPSWQYDDAVRFDEAGRAGGPVPDRHVAGDERLVPQDQGRDRAVPEGAQGPRARDGKPEMVQAQRRGDAARYRGQDRPPRRRLRRAGAQEQAREPGLRAELLYARREGRLRPQAQDHLQRCLPRLLRSETREIPLHRSRYRRPGRLPGRQGAFLPRRVFRLGALYPGRR